MIVRRAGAAATLLLAAVLAVGCSEEEGGDQDTFCTKVGEFNEGTASFDLNVADPDEIDRIAALLDDIEESAPSEIRDDVETHFEYVDDVIAASQGDQEAADRLAEAQPTTEESERINAFTQEVCGIALEPDQPPPSSTTILPTLPPTSTPPTTTTPPTSA
ncbi:MAG TPA: hypothetical protein VD926_13865 [Acidimicrobiales bacterium]|nr:hypothetical protein [Acidimicrobiales bacterium]